jgi:hypothetical protein
MVKQSLNTLPAGTFALSFYWTADGSGNVTATLSNQLPEIAQGMRILQVETVPGSPAPTNGYSVALKNSFGTDLMAGAMVSVSSTVNQLWPGSSVSPPFLGLFSLVITGNAVANAQGVVVVYFAAQQLINSNAGAVGPTGPAGPVGPRGASDLNTVTNYNFTPQPGGVSLTGGVAASINVSNPVLGLNGTDSGHYLWLTGGTGSPEAVLVTGGTYVSGASSGTIIFTPANNHSGAWTFQSATAGWQEAAQLLGGPGSVYFPDGVYDLYGPFTCPYSSQCYFGSSAETVTITQVNGNNLQRYAITGSKSNISFRQLGFDGNFINQTYTSSLNTCIDATSSIRLIVDQCRFHAFGYSVAANVASTQCISLYSALDFTVQNCMFFSNLALEVNANAASGGLIEGNTFGTGNVTESQSNVNYWDTYSGGFGIFLEGCTNMIVRRNQMYGCQRTADASFHGGFITVNEGRSQSSNHLILGNLFNGLGNSLGTLSVTNGFGAITGVNTQFVSGNVKMKLMVEGDLTIYTISAFASATSITVTPTMVRSTASGLRYQTMNSGDAINCYNVAELQVLSNVVTYCADNGFDVAGSPAGKTAERILFNGNQSLFCFNSGLYLGPMIEAVISSNLFVNNNQQGLSGHQGAIEMSPSDQGAETPAGMSHIMFDGNMFADDQASTTQLYCFQIETANASQITNCTIPQTNHRFDFTGSGSVSNATATQMGEMFNWAPFGGAAQNLTVDFADIGNIDAGNLVNGMELYCRDAKSIADGAAAGSTAVGSGTGTKIVRNNGAWKIMA